MPVGLSDPPTATEDLISVSFHTEAAPLAMVWRITEISMADAPYLVALALVELDGKRALPLTGKSQRQDSDGEPGEAGRTLALELLLRLWQRSDEGALRRAAAEDSLLLLEMPLEVMSERLPLIKADWIAGGTTEELLASLKQLAQRRWRIGIVKYQPATFTPWP